MVLLAGAALGCAGGLGGPAQRLTGEAAERTWRAHFGALPVGAARVVVVEDGFQDPIALGELVAPQADALAWLDGLSSTWCTWSATAPERSRVVAEGLHTTGALPLSLEDRPSPAREGWLVRTCGGVGFHYRVEVQPDGDLRWVLFSWFTS